MIFTADKLKEARDAGYSDDEIWSHVSSTDNRFNAAKSEGYSLDEVATFFSSQKPADTSIGDTLQKTAADLEMSIADIPLALGEAFSGLTKTVPASFYAAKEGLARPDQYSKEAIAAFDTQREYFKKLEQEAATRKAEGRMTTAGEAIRGAGQSLGFTVGGMAPSIVAGGLTGLAVGAAFPPAEAATVPIGVIASGVMSMVASAPVSYRMAGGQFLYDAFKSLEENKGSPLTEEEKTKAYNELLPIAQNTALWEAGPEAIGNAVQLGALKYAFGFGKKAATNVASQAIEKANNTLLKKVGAVAGGQAIELAGETITQTQQGPDQAKMEQYVQTGSTAGAPNEYEGLAGAVKAFKEVAPTTLALGAITAGAGGVVKVAGMGGKEVGKVLFTKPKTPEQIAEDQINDASNRVANELSISPDDTQANNLNQQIKALSQVQEIRKQTLAAIEPTSREAQTLKLDIAEGESMLGELNKQFTGLTGLSEPITEAERQQIELGKAITAQFTEAATPAAAPTAKEGLAVPLAQVAPVAAPVEQVVTPPVEVAPLPARTVEESIQNKDTFEFEGMRGAVSIEDGATVFRPFGTNDKYEVPINPNQSISEIEGIQWVRKGQTRQAPVEPTIPEVAAIVESQPQITEEEFNATEDDFQLPLSLIEIEKSPTLNAIADIFNTGESKIVQEGKRKNKVSATPEFYRQISPEQIDVANRQIDNALRIIDNLPVSEEQKQTLAEPYLLIDQDISSYENNPEYKQYKASIRREVRPAGEAVTLPETAGKTKPAAKKPKLGEKGGVLIPSREDFIQAGQNIYEAGMEFGTWAKQMIQQFGDIVREFLGDVWQAVSGMPAKLNELMGYLPKKGEAGAVNIGGGKKQPTKKPAEQEQIMGEKIGELKDTPKNIIAKTQELLRKKFDPTKVSEKNTTEAFRALGRLTGKDGNAFAQELNDVGRVIDESGAASEISMGAALFVNDLFEYSIRLAAEGDSKMLGIMMTNINKLPTAMVGASDAGRTLAARAELKSRFSMMGRAEQDAYTNYVAEFIYGPNPTKEQIKSIKDAYAAVEKTTQITEKELTDEIKAVGDRSGTDLVGKINEEFTKVTEKSKEKRKTEEEELDKEYRKIQKQADAEIEKLAKIQSDTPSFDPAAARQITNDVRAIVTNDLKQRPDMGRKAPWKSMLVAKLQEAGVEAAAAETLADIVWRQHEINNLSRELSSINKAIEKGPISEIVKAIKETPLEEQQNPNWRYEVMRDYLRRAGLNVAQSERIAKLMDISLQKRFTMAQEQAFTDAISKTAPWKAGDTRSRRAFQKVLQALRAGALDPARNVLSDMAALNGWTGFTADQYKTLLKNDAIISDPESADATKAEAHKAIQDIISKAKLPIRARDVIGQYYDAQALSGIQTATVNIFSPAGMAAKNALTQALNGLLTARPDQITASLTTFIDSIKSWANTVAYSFKNNVTVYSNVEYLVNDEGLLKLYKKGVDQFNNGKTPRDKADGVKNMMIGMMDYVRRILNALDYGAIASLQNQAVSKYALAVMQAKGMSSKDGAKMLNAMMEQKRNFYNDQIAIGTDKNKAAVLADEFFISSWRQALTDARLPAQEVMDAALNDAMSSVGRNRQSLDAFREEDTNTRDEGVFSFPAIWLLETMANAANKQDNQFIKIFSRIIYGFAVVPARVFRETAWFSPYGAVRFAYYHIAKKMGLKNPYAQSLGNNLQYRQRLTETAAGSLVMLAFAAAMSSSAEDEEDKKPFKIVVTGNGPLRNEDPQYYDSWMKKNKPNTVSVYFGKTKFTINTMRGFEAFAWPAMMLGAVDDWNIRRKQKRETNTPKKMGDAAIIGGFVLSASLRRGPYAFAAKPLFESYGDRGVESLAKSLTFPAKTLLPGLGSSLAKNFSDLLNEPVDRKTLEGALWANIPFIGPAVAPKSLNAFGEPALANEAADKIFKLGIPITFEIPNDRQSVMLHELVLKQGGGPSIPNRSQLAKRLDREPTNKEFEMFVKEYGSLISEDMKANYTDLFEASPEGYSKYVEKIGSVARDIAEARVREKFEKP